MSKHSVKKSKERRQKRRALFGTAVGTRPHLVKREMHTAAGRPTARTRWLGPFPLSDVRFVREAGGPDLLALEHVPYKDGIALPRHVRSGKRRNRLVRLWRSFVPTGQETP